MMKGSNSFSGIKAIKSQPFIGIPLPDIDIPQPVNNTLKFDTQNQNCINLKTSNPPPFHVVLYNDKIPHILPDTMVKILQGKYNDSFGSVYVIDCRFFYEYEDGHIKGAINTNDLSVLIDMFFKEIKDNSLIIFHCEFSQNRGPEIASLFRSYDRKVNKDCYPKLHYPHVYVLHNGYKEFFRKFPEHCDGGYTKMVNPIARSNGDLVRANAKYNNNIKKAKKELDDKEDEESTLIKRRNSCQVDFLGGIQPVSPLIRHLHPRFEIQDELFTIEL